MYLTKIGAEFEPFRMTVLGMFVVFGVSFACAWLDNDSRRNRKTQRVTFKSISVLKTHVEPSVL